MPAIPGEAARIGDQTNHGGTVVGSEITSVMIGGKPAAVAAPQFSMHSVPDQSARWAAQHDPVPGGQRIGLDWRLPGTTRP